MDGDRHSRRQRTDLYPAIAGKAGRTLWNLHRTRSLFLPSGYGLGQYPATFAGLSAYQPGIFRKRETGKGSAELHHRAGCTYIYPGLPA